jgi:hypothetical protein
VTYWIGRSYWGKGIASDALNAFLAVDRSRPPRHAPSGAKFENDFFVERPDESASGDAHAA